MKHYWYIFSIIYSYETKGVKWQKDKPLCPGLHIEEPSSAPKPSKKKKQKEACDKDTNTPKHRTESRREVDQVSERLQATVINNDTPQQPVDAAKRLKNLRKRLAQIDALKMKMESGELSKPDPDQIRKVERREEVANEIASLEKLLWFCFSILLNF